MKLDQKLVLTGTSVARSRSTVRRHYAEWRHAQGMSERCDNPKCQLHSGRLIWNGRPLVLILDHISGNSHDNRPENLRLLCPNCDAQNVNTKGGANAGRVERLVGGSYHVKHRDGRQDAYAFGTLASVGLTPANATALTSSQRSEDSEL